MTRANSMSGLVARIVEGIEDETLRPGFKAPFSRGSASGYVTVIEDAEEQDNLLLQVSLTIMKVPTRHPEVLYRRLLEINMQLQGRAAFSVDTDDIVWLTAGRPMEDLDPGEVLDLVLWTAEHADNLDDILLSEFGHEYRP